MKILNAEEESIITASRLVRDGGVVVFPTDTVYGIGCNPFRIEAVNRVFGIKGDRDKPLPVLASDLSNIEKIAHLSKLARRIAERFWPGPLTLILPKKHTLPNVVTRNLNSVGVRIPKHDVAIKLIRLSGGLLTGTSANKTGSSPSRTANEAIRQLRDEVDLVIDGGPTPIGTSSTVINALSKNPLLLREGPVSLEEILADLDL
jgi:L-threonylcarbamoyladenylate synthase